MEDMLQKRVRAAAIAGWWTLLVAVIFHLFVTSGFAVLMHAKPSWVTSAWGGLSWDEIKHVGLYMIGTYRVLVWLMFLVVVWLTIWSRRLKRIQ
jgi:hypothetical protein